MGVGAVVVAVVAFGVAANDGVGGVDNGVVAAAGVSAGVIDGDVAGLVDVGVGIETVPFALHVRAPLTLRLIDNAPSTSTSLPSTCRVVRCEEFLSGQRLDPTALARLVDEVRLFHEGDVVFARAGQLTSTFGAGATVDRLTTLSSWDRRTSGAYAALRLPWRDIVVEAMTADVISPLELLAARGQGEVVAFGDVAGVVVGAEFGVDAFAPDDLTDAGGATRPGAATRVIGAGVVDVSLPVSLGIFTLAPRLEGGVAVGLDDDGVGVGDGGVGGVGGVGGQVGLQVAFMELRAQGMVSASTPRHRRGLFSSLYLVERRRAVVGSAVDGGGIAHVGAPGGVGADARLDVSVLDGVSGLARLHLEPAAGGNAAELGLGVDIDPVLVSLSVVRRGFVDAAGVVGTDVNAVPLIMAAEASYRFWGPFSLWGRWYRLPRLQEGAVSIDDDVFVGVSFAGALVSR